MRLAASAPRPPPARRWCSDEPRGGCAARDIHEKSSGRWEKGAMARQVRAKIENTVALRMRCSVVVESDGEVLLFRDNAELLVPGLLAGDVLRLVHATDLARVGVRHGA